MPEIQYESFPIIGRIVLVKDIVYQNYLYTFFVQKCKGDFFDHVIYGLRFKYVPEYEVFYG